MGDPARYPEIRTARFIYAMQRLPRDFTADVQARQQWVDNNLTYLDGLVLADLHYHDADFRRDSWSTYHNLHMPLGARGRGRQGCEPPAGTDAGLLRPLVLPRNKGGRRTAGHRPHAVGL
eukprot:scaffold5591_cov122-Isochrysis_galbana.AAC.1